MASPWERIGPSGVVRVYSAMPPSARKKSAMAIGNNGLLPFEVALVARHEIPLFFMNS